MNKILEIANYYKRFGMNVVPLQVDEIDSNSPIEEACDIDWQNYFNCELELNMIQGWSPAKGLGLIAGYNNYRTIDIEGLNRPYGGHDMIARCLQLLNLPSNYPWIYHKDRKWHIIIKSHESGKNVFEPVSKNDIVSLSYSPSYRWSNIWCDKDWCELTWLFKRLKLTWRNIIELPSNLLKQQFLHSKFPVIEPQFVSIQNIEKLFNYYCSTPVVYPFHLDDETYSHYEFFFALRKYDYIENELFVVRNQKFIFERISHGEVINQKKVDDKEEWLLTCGSSDSYNTLGTIKAHVGKLDEAIKYFEMSGNWMAQFNLKMIEKHRNAIPIIHCELMGTYTTEIEEKPGCYLFVDTETTRLPRDYSVPASDVDNWPRLVQLSWRLTDEAGNVLSSHNHIISPQDYVIPVESTMIHGITQSMAKQNGEKLRDVLRMFMSDYRNSRVLVGHNVQFDISVIGAELYRIGNPQAAKFCLVPSICTMKSTVEYCAIPSRYGYGYDYPKLQTLYMKLFGHEFQNSHNANADVEATAQCFFELKKRGIL